jgi:hypothetical protein
VLQRDMPPIYLISILLHHAALSCAMSNHCVPGISRAETSSYAHWFHVMRVLPRGRLWPGAECAKSNWKVGDVTATLAT